MRDPVSEMPAYFISEDDVRSLLGGLDRGALYATVAANEARSHFDRISADAVSRISLRCAPPVESAKSFLFPARERVAVYPGGPAEPETGLSDETPQMILGLRACDLQAIEILDKVMLEGDFADPFYAERREHTLLFSTDCVRPAPACFCNLVGGQPYPDGGYDLNFSPVAGGYLVAIGSQVGKEIVLESAHSFREATAERLQERENVRDAAVRVLESQNARYKPRRPIEEALAGSDFAERWTRLAAACVECGACNFACPTCHCFLLYDQVVSGKVGLNERLKAWDSCFMASFAKMAGVGGVKVTPRPDLPRRFENRVRHKFQWFRQNVGRLGCVGCGRCSEACLGGRDIREVIRELGE